MKLFTWIQTWLIVVFAIVIGVDLLLWTIARITG